MSGTLQKVAAAFRSLASLWLGERTARSIDPGISTAPVSAPDLTELISAACPPRDLFGQLVDGPRPVGRPRYAPSDAVRRRVVELSDAGANQTAIAEAVGLSVPTLRLAYGDVIRREPRPVRRCRAGIKQGRPAHEPTPAQRARVVELRQAGAIASAIAEAIGVSRTTLFKQYRQELALTGENHA